jgi:hypothetical protein
MLTTITCSLFAIWTGPEILPVCLIIGSPHASQGFCSFSMALTLPAIESMKRSEGSTLRGAGWRA